jgi:hypothetical protein
VYEEGRRWFDNATKEKGDMIDFLAKMKGFSNAEAYIKPLQLVDGPAEAKRVTAPT